VWQSLLPWVERGNGLRQSGYQDSSTWAYYHTKYQHPLSHRDRWGLVVKQLVIMEEDQRKEVEELIGQMQCSKDFRCYQSGLEVRCKAKDIGIELFLECLEENPQKCSFSFRIASTNLCQCPLRVYIAKKLKK
jgi:hypothetical protein